LYFIYSVKKWPATLRYPFHRDINYVILQKGQTTRWICEWRVKRSSLRENLFNSKPSLKLQKERTWSQTHPNPIRHWRFARMSLSRGACPLTMEKKTYSSERWREIRAVDYIVGASYRVSVDGAKPLRLFPRMCSGGSSVNEWSPHFNHETRAKSKTNFVNEYVSFRVQLLTSVFWLEIPSLSVFGFNKISKS
jgi:hypothetical protein